MLRHGILLPFPAGDLGCQTGLVLACHRAASSTFLDTDMKHFLPRRTFVQLCSALGAYLASPSGPRAVAAPLRKSAEVKNRKNFVAIQVKPHAWLDEGIDKVLD